MELSIWRKGYGKNFKHEAVRALKNVQSHSILSIFLFSP